MITRIKMIFFADMGILIEKNVLYLPKSRKDMVNTPNAKFQTVEEYFSALPANIGKILKELRKTIKKASPQAEELISYNMPAFKQNGMLVWYAAFREHIGFFPRPSAVSKFKKELSGYKVSKGTIRFPIDMPLPLSLISRIVKFRVKENLEKARMKSK